MNKLQVLLSRAHLWVSHHVAGDASASPQEEQHCLSPGAGAGPSLWFNHSTAAASNSAVLAGSMILNQQLFSAIFCILMLSAAAHNVLHTNHNRKP